LAPPLKKQRITSLLVLRLVSFLLWLQLLYWSSSGFLFLESTMHYHQNQLQTVAPVLRVLQLLQLQWVSPSLQLQP
jgi:hypothetical protein